MLSNLVSISNDYVIQNNVMSVGNISKSRILNISIDSTSFDVPSGLIPPESYARFGNPNEFDVLFNLGSLSSTDVPVNKIGGMRACMQFYIIFLN